MTGSRNPTPNWSAHQMSGGLGGGLPSQFHLQQAQMAAQAQANWLQAHSGLMHATSSSSFGPSHSGARHHPPLMAPDPKRPDTLGWREWRWSDADKMLKSPSTGTLWPEAELVVPNWDEGEAVRGTSGIHAHLVPKHWKILGETGGGYVPAGDPSRVHGIVERFGKYVLGTEGWRAEWVVIKELMAPSTEVGLAIEQAYPDVIVHYPEDEGEESCTSATSSKLGKGSRSTSRPKPSPLPNPSPSPNSSQVFQQSTLTPGNPAWRAQNGLPPLKSASLSPSSPDASQQSPSRSLSSSETEKPKRTRPSLNDVCAVLAVLAVFVWLVVAFK
jgi:hypothetical protein